MRNKLFFLALLQIFVFFKTEAQTVTAPPDGGTTTQVRLPNGLSGYAYHRAVFFIPKSELSGFTNGNVINYMYTLLTNGGDVVASGNIKIYLQNTTDVSNSKSTDFATIISPMTKVYDGSYVIPNTTNSSIKIQLTTPFTYTGNGLYVATDFVSTGPFSTTPATYRANSTLTNSCFSAQSSSSSPATLTSTTAFRPSIIYSNSVLSVLDNMYENSINIENPIDKFLKLDYNGNLKISSIEIIDLSGKKILDNKVESGKKTIDLSNLKTGVYILKIITKENKIITKKIIKK